MSRPLVAGLVVSHAAMFATASLITYLFGAHLRLSIDGWRWQR